ncbi:MAG: chloride channel protein [Bacteroides sp.]|nr:chloride channel protein [Bacteroides sp.]MCM1550711.1 chloride channel protein [Clostridium sp.]
MKPAEEIAKEEGHQLLTFGKWLIFSLLTGAVVGVFGSAFSLAMSFVTGLRQEHTWLICFLPLAGLLIVWLYKLCHQEHHKGTNLVIAAIRTDELIHARTAPLIFFSTLLTHLCGGSSGREGAALQFGGSIGESIGRIFHFDEKDRTIIIMCGMSAAFSAVFGTPLAAVIFPMEMVSVGIMYYAALVPCTVASLTAYQIAQFCGIEGEQLLVSEIPELTLLNTGKIGILAIFCAFLSIAFCVVLHTTEKKLRQWITNPYLRIAVCGVGILGLTWIFGTDYNGTGMDIIRLAVEEGQVFYGAFLLKLIFTALTLGSGYKGGEIVPSFFLGATFGCLMGHLLGLSPMLCAAAGMTGVFCGVTNSPMTSLFISFELFGMEGMPYYLIVIAICYMLSGYFGLYKSQKIMYSKSEPTYINRESD